MKGYRWVVLAAVLLASFIAYFLRSSFTVVGESMVRDLGITEVQLGFIFSAFGLGYAIFQFPGGIAGDKFGPRLVITVTAIAWGVITALTALVPGADAMAVSGIIAILVVLRFLFGVVQAPIFPVTTGTIAVWFPQRQWGLPNGLSSTFVTLGGAAAAPATVVLIDMFGWRSTLLLTAPLGLVIGLYFYWIVRDDPKEHPKIEAEELAMISEDKPPAGHVPEKGAWKLALKDKNILLISTSYMCMNYVFYLFFYWFFFYLVEVKGLSAADAGFFTAIQWILGSIGATLGGLLLDFLVRRIGIRLATRRQVITSMFLCAVFLFVGANAENPVLSIALLSLAFLFTQVSEPPYWTSTMAIAGRHAPVAAGVMNTGGNVPSIVGGALVPLTAIWFGWTTAMALGSVFAVIAGLLWLLIRADEPMSDEVSAH